MNKKTVIALLATWVLASVDFAHAQAKVYRVGVILEGGPLYVTVDGLNDGLKELGFEEGKHYVLEIRDVKGDLKAAQEAARSLEREKVNLIYVVSTSVVTEVKRATVQIPIVFAVGRDPVVAGLVDSFAKPGGRFTGVHYLSADLTAKRLEILKEILPDLRKVVTFYDPSNPTAMASAKSYYEVGRLSAKYVQRVLTGASPRNLPVESISRVGLAVNLKTARELGLTIPQAVRLRADKVIQ